MLKLMVGCATGIGLLLGLPGTTLPAEQMTMEKEEITTEEFDMMASCVMAESGGEDFETQYWVAETILNRRKSELFPDTIKEVIFEPHQFEVVSNGSIYEATPTDSVYEAVQSALEEDNVPRDILYFTSEGYLKGTIPYKKIGNMYFSKQKKER